MCFNNNRGIVNINIYRERKIFMNTESNNESENSGGLKMFFVAVVVVLSILFMSMSVAGCAFDWKFAGPTCSIRGGAGKSGALIAEQPLGSSTTSMGFGGSSASKSPLSD